jgi:NAD(P)-dependent dehydrogenase (short-subunit alcohol dehydrogenase family)
LVTGASSGIGRATARELVARGWRVFGSVRREEDEGALEAEGMIPVRLDVTDAKSVEAAWDQVKRALDGETLNALVNNAGVTGYGPLEHTSAEQLQAILEVNVIGVHRVTRAFLPLLRVARGRIVNVSSTSGRFALPFLGAYAASKHALEAWSDSLRREVAEAGVTVVIVQPGRVDTRMVREAPIGDVSLFEGTPYEAGTRDLARRVREQSSPPLAATVVAAVIADALEARRPRTRSMVVPGSWWTAWAAGWLPARWLDWLLARPRSSLMRINRGRKRER